MSEHRTRWTISLSLTSWEPAACWWGPARVGFIAGPLLINREGR